MPPLTLGMFGAFQVTLANGSTARFESSKVRALLAYLAVQADRPHRRDALIGLLWPDESEGSARHNLRQILFSLRQAIKDPSARPPYLLISRDEIQFNPASQFSLDVASFHAHLAATANHSHARVDACAICAPRLQQAVDLYRGQFLQEFFLEDSAEFEAWAMAQRESLHQRALDALTDLGNYYEQTGDARAAKRCALRQLELDPWREQAHRQMMRVFASAGQMGAALAQYETCRRVLADEMGVEPSSETQELYEKIKSGNSKWEVGKTPPTSSVQPLTSNFKLPTHLTPFVGREREMAELAKLIGDQNCRWITLVGPGGIGKTRLAVQAASNQRDAFAQGVLFVPLVDVDSVEAIVPAIAHAAGLSFFGPTSPRVQLFNYLSDKQMLLILDNVEQLLDAAELLVEMLSRTAEIKLLLTSREPLNVQGEWAFPVEGLQVPAEDREEAIESLAAVVLFVQRAQRARVGFVLREQDRPSLGQLCRLVGGTPLALELAATWVRTLSVAEIVNEIERDLNFLSSPVRDLPERHRSIRAVFDRSWELLAAEEQRVLRDLSVFRGPFRRQAAEQVARASLTTLSALVSKSLVRRTDTGHYDLHELIRQSAAAKQGEDLASVSARHSRYYLDWLGQCTAPLQDHRQKETVAELSAEVNNLRAAWEWAIAHHELAPACQVSATLWHLFELRTWLTEGETIFRNAAETIESRSAQITPDAADVLALHIMRAHSAYFSFRLGKSEMAYAALVPSVQYLQSSTDRFARIYAPWYLGIVCWELGRFAEAHATLQAGLEQARAAKEQWWECFVSEFIGMVALATGDLERARRYLTEALAGARAMGDPMFIAHVLVYLSQTSAALGEVAQAESLLRESLALAQEIGYRHGIGRALDGLGQLLQASNPHQARLLFASSGQVFREIGDLGILSVVLCHQGHNSLALGDITDAHASFLEVLRLARQGGFAQFALDGLLGLAFLSARNSDDARALELVGQILRHPATAHAAKTRAAKLRAEIAARLTPQQVEAIQARADAIPFEEVMGDLLKQA